MVRVEGIEPSTFWFQTKHATAALHPVNRLPSLVTYSIPPHKDDTWHNATALSTRAPILQDGKSIFDETNDSKDTSLT